MGNIQTWMIYKGTSHLELDDGLGVPPFQETSIWAIDIPSHSPHPRTRNGRQHMGRSNGTDTAKLQILISWQAARLEVLWCLRS